MSKKVINKDDLLIDDSALPGKIDLTPEEEKEALEELQKLGLLEKQ